MVAEKSDGDLRLAREACFRFALRFRFAHPFTALRLIGQRLPCGLGPAATLAHMLERRRFPLGPCLLGPGEEEIEIRISKDWPGHLLDLVGVLVGRRRTFSLVLGGFQVNCRHLAAAIFL